MLKEMTRSVRLMALIAVAGAAAAPPAMAQSYDDAGCRTVARGCAQADRRRDEDSDTAAITTVTNRCGERIVVRLCNEIERNDSYDWICHTFALADGDSRDQTTFFATGALKVHAIGSRDSSADAACRRRHGLGS